jgi:YfiH family protein
MIELLWPEWEAPAPVRACSTTRAGGFSEGRYASFNLGGHVGDDDEKVIRNRELLTATLALAREPDWIRQTHSTRAVVLEQDHRREADAAVTRQAGNVAVIMTADCLPILLCNRDGTEVAALHAGWRGLQAGIIDSTLAAMQTPASQLRAWIGPGISQEFFEVGDEVYAAYVESIDGCDPFFETHGPGHWLCDLGGIAQHLLERRGVAEVARDAHCTYRDEALFYSYRRDGLTGRMATMIWIDSPTD